MNLRTLLCVGCSLLLVGVKAAEHREFLPGAPLWVEQAVAVRQEANPPEQEKADGALARDIEADQKLGAEVYKEIAEQVTFDETEEIGGRVSAIGAKLALIANDTHALALWGDKRFVKLDYKFFVIKDDEVNAFSVPGGYIYIYTGLLDFCESDDELAGVIGHEIAHASFRHVAEMQKRRSTIDLATLPLLLVAILTNSPDAGNAMIGMQALSLALSSGWSVEAETSADYGGLQYIRKSDYNPTGLLTFMERLGARDRLSPVQNLGILRTHPPSSERIQFLRTEMNNLDIPIQRSKVTKSFRASIESTDVGSLRLMFGEIPIHDFNGSDAIPRADAAVEALNQFFDKEPYLMDFEMTSTGVVRGLNRRLFEVRMEDLEGQNRTLNETIEEVRNNMKRALFDFNFKIGQSRTPR
ncbi:MAG: M48 family metalloprotease [Fimbriimonadaceae bacterium]|nr:M48 family metalloprotease [Fimbriimonadaceae bacterium]